MGVAGCLLDFCVGFGTGRRGLNVILALGAVSRPIGANFRAGCWGLNAVIASGVVSRLKICINDQTVSL